MYKKLYIVKSILETACELIYTVNSTVMLKMHLLSSARQQDVMMDMNRCKIYNFLSPLFKNHIYTVWTNRSDFKTSEVYVWKKHEVVQKQQFQSHFLLRSSSCY